ncbi:hypothetical protein [Microbulbifer epialgicus]|uniref:Single-stranded DNA-binding protein n=1 Tax=Microbulbifer epialgicus TaxID=393907 RepID=A0ABV4P237_9GAMM
MAKTILTPVTAAKFPHLVTPNDHFNKENPTYETKQVFDMENDEHVAWLERFREQGAKLVEDFRAEIVKKGGKLAAQAKKAEVILPIEEDYDVEGEGEEQTYTPNGNFVLKMKQYSLYKDKKTGEMKKRSLPLIDTAKNPVKTGDFYTGSKLVVAFRPNVSMVQGKLYLTCYIEAVQIHELATGHSALDAFGVFEDGFKGAASSDESTPDSDGYDAGGDSSGSDEGAPNFNF